MSGDCEYLIRHRRKPDLEYSVRCTLTGHECFCEDVSPNLCTRRTFALQYEAKQNERIDKVVNLVILDSKNRPQST